MSYDDPKYALREQYEVIRKRGAENERLRAGFMACIMDKNECDAWLYGSACRARVACKCELDLELWCNRAHKENT